MTTARTVPVTREMDGDELDAEDAWHQLRRHGVRSVLVESFVRFRYGDGFTHSRALALQTCLAIVPFMLALTGLAADLDQQRAARVMAATVEAVSPGAGQQDALADALVGGSEEAGELALAFGLAFALLVDDDRDGAGRARWQPDLRDSSRSAGARQVRQGAVFTAVLAVPLGLGFLLLVAGGAFGEAMVRHYAWSEDLHLWWDILWWPAGLVMLVIAIAVLFDHAPRRRQPALSWLALGP